MEQNKQGLTEEQQAYIDSFGEAMRAMEAEYKRLGRYDKAYLELKRMGAWDKEYISRAYVLVVGKLSPLSARLRSYITGIGALAHRIYDESFKLKEQKGNGKERRKKR